MNKELIPSTLNGTKAPAGNGLVAHPDFIDRAAWNRVTVEHIYAGQTRLYAGSVWEARILIEGGTPSTREGFDVPFATKIKEDRVKLLTKALVHEFSDSETPAWHEPKLASLEIESEGTTYRIWRAKITQECLD